MCVTSAMNNTLVVSIRRVELNGTRINSLFISSSSTILQVSGGDDSSIIISSYLTGKSVSLTTFLQAFSLKYLNLRSITSCLRLSLRTGIYLLRAFCPRCFVSLFVYSIFIIFIHSWSLYNEWKLCASRNFYYAKIGLRGRAAALIYLAMM